MTGRVLVATAVAAGALLPVTAPVGPAACAAGSVRVAVVVDFSDVAATTETCVAAGERDTGAAVLVARARLLGRPAPRYASSGLLCAIDGYPAEGCGVRTEGRYAYWAYYLGTSSGWSYAAGGPAGRRVNSATVEGWRWHPAGTGVASDPPPRAPARPDLTCPPPAPPTTPGTIAPPASVSTAPAGPGEPAPEPTPSDPPDSVTTPGTEPASARPSSTTAPASARPPDRPVRAAAPAVPPAPPLPPGGDRSPIGALAGIALLAGIVTVGATVGRRRRRT